MKPDPPKKGYYFAYTFKEIMKGLSSSEDREISIYLSNPKRKSEFGVIVAEFHPGAFYTFFSLPKSTPETIGKAAFTRLLRKIKTFLLIDRKSRSIESRIVAYLAKGAMLIYTQRDVHYQAVKYRGAQKWSGQFRPKVRKIEEKVIARE